MNDGNNIPHYIPPEGGYKEPDDFWKKNEEGQPDTEKKSSFKSKRYTAVILAAVLTAIIAVLIIVSVRTKNKSDKKLYLKDYISLEMSGADSYGKARVRIDHDDFVRDALKVSGKSSKDTTEVNRIEDLYYSILVSINKDSGLSNGDKVRTEASWNEEKEEKAGVEVVFRPYDIEIKNLIKTKVVYPFNFAHVTFNGVNDYVSVDVENTSDDDRLMDVFFYVTDMDGNRCDNGIGYVKDGDRVKVCVYEDDAQRVLEEYGIELSPMTKEYTVSCTHDLAMTVNDISSETLKNAQEEAIDVIYSSTGSGNIKDLQYVGFYFMSPYFAGSSNKTNHLYVVFEGQIANEDGGFITRYLPVEFFSIIGDGDEQVIGGTREVQGLYGGMGFLDEKDMFNKLISQEATGYLYQISGSLTDYGQAVALPGQCSDIIGDLIRAGTFYCDDGIISREDGRIYTKDGSWNIEEFITAGYDETDHSFITMMNTILTTLTCDGSQYTEKVCDVRVNSAIGSFYFDKDEGSGTYYLVYKYSDSIGRLSDIE